MSSKRHFIKGLGALASVGMMPKAAFGRSNSAMDHTNYRMPDEAAPHLRTFMQWPVSSIVHSDPVFLEMLQQTIADIANTIVQFEPVIMLMGGQIEKQARRKLSEAIEIWNIPTEDLWCRDSGPVFVKNNAGKLAVSQFNFNGWGNKQVHEYDGKIAGRVAERLGLDVLDNGLVGEAGGVEFDGKGTLIAHESSWVNINRNKGSKSEIEKLLLEAVGGRKVIWAPGLAGADITDYHIDSLARFISPGKVLIQMPDKVISGDPWSASAFETYNILKNSTDADGQKLQLVAIPEPTITRVTSNEFVASYVNYYICNGAIIAAEYGDREKDEEAEKSLAELYPGRQVVMLNIDPVGEVGGGVHCTTQQQPSA